MILAKMDGVTTTKVWWRCQYPCGGDGGGGDGDNGLVVVICGGGSQNK